MEAGQCILHVLKVTLLSLDHVRVPELTGNQSTLYTKSQSSCCFRSLGEVLHHSIDMPVVNSQHNHTKYQQRQPSPVEQMQQSEHLTPDSAAERNVVVNKSSSVTDSSQHVENHIVEEENEFDSIKSSITMLQHVNILDVQIDVSCCVLH